MKKFIVTRGILLETIALGVAAGWEQRDKLATSRACGSIMRKRGEDGSWDKCGATPPSHDLTRQWRDVLAQDVLAAVEMAVNQARVQPAGEPRISLYGPDGKTPVVMEN